MRHRRRWIAWSASGLLAAVAVAALAGRAAAQEDGSEATPLRSPFIEREEVRFVALDLIAEKKIKGRWRRVPGLTAERVRVFVGDEEMSLDVFENRCPAQAPPAPAGNAGPATTTPAPAGGEAAEAETFPTRRFVLYFDLIHLKQEGFGAAFDAAREWAATAFQPDDEVMIVTGAVGLRIIRPLLPASESLDEDLSAAKEAFRRTAGWAEMEGSQDYGRIREISDLVNFETSPFRPADEPVMPKSLASAYAAEDFRYARRSVQNLQDLMTLFESIEGTKNLIFFEQTVRMYPGRQYPFAEDLTEMRPFLQNLAEAANERNVRIYPVDTGGMEGEEDEAMFLLAEETGGQFYRKSNDLAPTLEWVDEDLTCFYSLGFRVRPEFSGTVRRIQIEIDGPRQTHKYRTRHRKTLLDPTREARDAALVQAALLAPSSADDFEVSVTAVPLFEHGASGRVRLQITVPFDALLFLPAGAPGQETSQIAVQMGASVLTLQPGGANRDTDRRGNVLADVSTDVVPWKFERGARLALPGLEGAQQTAGATLFLSQEIDAPPGDYRLVAVMQDQHARELGAGSDDFRVPAEPPFIGTLRLAVQAPRTIAVDPVPPPDPDGSGKKRERKVRAAVTSLPAGLLLQEKATLAAGAAGRIVFGVCGADTRGPVDDWQLAAVLTCGDQRIPTGPVPAPTHPEGVAESCGLAIHPLPETTLPPGECRYELSATLPDGAVETRDLAFRVTPPGG